MSPDTVVAGDIFTITVSIMDSISGMAGTGFPGNQTGVLNETGVEIAHVALGWSFSSSTWQWISGNTYTNTIYVDPLMPAGLWGVKLLSAWDIAGNNKIYYNQIDFTAFFTVLPLPQARYVPPAIHCLNHTYGYRGSARHI